MAYLKLGLTRPELAGMYLEDVKNGVPATDLVGRYGRNPQLLLEDREAPGYSDLKVHEFEDDRERQYARVDIADRRRLFVRLPIGITRRQNHGNKLFHEVQEFPKPGDTIRIKMASRGRKRHNNGDTDKDGDETVYSVVGINVPRGHVATAQVILDRDLPEREDVEPDERFQHQLERRVEAEKRKYHIKEGETELSLETRRLLAGASRKKSAHSSVRRGNHISAPRAPRAQSARSNAVASRTSDGRRYK